MVSFHTPISALALALLVFGPFPGAAQTELQQQQQQRGKNRRLDSFEQIAGYRRLFQATDYNAIDLDLREMKGHMALGTAAGFERAWMLYKEGSHSSSVARLVLETPWPTDIEGGARVTGFTADGTFLEATTHERTPKGATVVLIRYGTLDDGDDRNGSRTGCRVGASAFPDTEGCFAASGELGVDDVRTEILSDGTELLTASDFGIGYSYDPLSDNLAPRSLRSLSTSAVETMYQCMNCPYRMYQLYYSSYGAFDYADRVVSAGLTGTSTNLKNLNAEFGFYAYDGRKAAVETAIVALVVWMAVSGELEAALDYCYDGCPPRETCNGGPAKSWDAAAAYYTGSSEGVDGGDGSSGDLLRDFADELCETFRTCGTGFDRTTGQSRVNTEIFRQFDVGREQLARGECDSARETKEAIEKWMVVLLIQGTLRSAWNAAANNNTSEEEGLNDEKEANEAKGVVLALAVYPHVWNCDDSAAQVIAANFRATTGTNREQKTTSETTTDFVAVKAALESTYRCLGIDDGAAVGGLWNDATDSYHEGAEPYVAPTRRPTEAPTRRPTEPPVGAPAADLDPLKFLGSLAKAIANLLRPWP